MKKIIPVLLCTAALVGTGTLSFAAAVPTPNMEATVSVNPRFATIDRVNGTYTQSGSKITCKGRCRTNRNVNISVTITLKDNATGKQTSSSGSESGIDYTHSAKFNVVSGKKYTITYAYNAGGEKTSESKSFTAK